MERFLAVRESAGQGTSQPTEIVIELLGDVAGQLKMLLLVLAHGDMGRVVD